MPVRRQGFTLVELLVVIGILGILMGLLMPAVQAVRSVARRTSCMNNHRQLALAIRNYESAHRKYPGPYFDAYPNSLNYTRDVGIVAKLLQFLDLDQLWEQYDTNTTAFDPVNQPVVTTTPPILYCPEGDGPAWMDRIVPYYNGPETDGLSAATWDYRFNKGFYERPILFDKCRGPIVDYVEDAGGGFHLLRAHSSQVSDGLSNTILTWDSVSARAYQRRDDQLVELEWELFYAMTFGAWLPYYTGGPAFPLLSSGDGAYWSCWGGRGTGSARASRPDDGQAIGSYFASPDVYTSVVNMRNTSGEPFSFHSGLCPVSFADGHVALVDEQIGPREIYALVSATGGEVIDQLP